MGQKTHPKGFRVGIIQSWDSTWFAKKDYPEFVAEDAKIRKYIKKRLYTAGISKILIARKAQNVIITVVTAKPGIVVGRGGQGIEELRADVAKLIKKNVTMMFGSVMNRQVFFKIGIRLPIRCTQVQERFRATRFI